MSLRCLSTTAFKRQTAALLTIGDEVLCGKTLDTNSHHAAKLCFKHGLDLKFMATVPDCKESIGHHVRECSQTYNYVFTSGGIGPTHDDITYESIAAAFDIPLAFHQPTLDRMRRYFDNKKPPSALNEARKRMAFLPRVQAPLTEVLYHQDSNINFPLSWIPIVCVHNVYIFPGVPKLYEALSEYIIGDVIAPKLMQKALYQETIALKEMEGDIAEFLSQLQQQYVSRVRIGSYPRFTPDQDGTRIIITFQGEDEDAVRSCSAALANSSFQIVRRRRS